MIPDLIHSGDGNARRVDGRAPIRIVSDGVHTRVLTALGEEIPHVTAVEFSATAPDPSYATITVMANVDLTVYGHKFEKEDDDADRD